MKFVLMILVLLFTGCQHVDVDMYAAKKIALFNKTCLNDKGYHSESYFNPTYVVYCKNGNRFDVSVSEISNYSGDDVFEELQRIKK